MISQLLQQLGLSVAGVLQSRTGIMIGELETGVFHVSQAERSPYIPAQQEFVIPFGIKSVVGFGDVLPDGSLFAVIGFATKSITGEVAELFSHLSHTVKLGLLSYLDVEDKVVAQIRAFDRLLANRERLAVDQEQKLRRAAAELAAANKALEQSNADLQQFAYSASHDLQTPLRSVAGFAELLVREYKGRLDATADDYLERVASAAKRMQQMIHDLLVHTRIESWAAALQPVNLNVVFDDALALLQAPIKECGGDVTRDELPVVVGDHTQLLQLLQNLIVNGIKYRGDDPPRVHVSAHRDGDRWTIAVRDNGIGIAAEYQERIFEIFYRLHTEQGYPGSGIGLATCRRIVHRHHGKIWVESQPDHGSTFSFTLEAAS
jgi:signal transduction histidine kinase